MASSHPPSPAAPMPPPPPPAEQQQFKQLDYNVPLLSVRRAKLRSGADAPAMATDTHPLGSCKHAAAVPPPLPPLLADNYNCNRTRWKLSSELSKQPVRLPGAIPFEWEQSPGRPKQPHNLTPHTIESSTPSPPSSASFKDPFCVVESLHKLDIRGLDGEGELGSNCPANIDPAQATTTLLLLSMQQQPPATSPAATEHALAIPPNSHTGFPTITPSSSCSSSNSAKVAIPAAELLSFERLSNHGAPVCDSLVAEATPKTKNSAAPELMRSYSGTKRALGVIVNTSVSSCKPKLQRRRRSVALRNGQDRYGGTIYHYDPSSTGSAPPARVMLDYCSSRGLPSLHLLREAVAHMFSSKWPRSCTTVAIRQMPVPAVPPPPPPVAQSSVRHRSTPGNYAKHLAAVKASPHRAASSTSRAGGGGDRRHESLRGLPHHHGGTVSLYAGHDQRGISITPSRSSRSSKQASKLSQRVGKRLWLDISRPARPGSPTASAASPSRSEKDGGYDADAWTATKRAGASVPPTHVFPGKCESKKKKKKWETEMEMEARKVEGVGWPLGLSGYPPARCSVSVLKPNPNPKAKHDQNGGDNDVLVPLPPQLPAPPHGGSWLKKALSTSPHVMFTPTHPPKGGRGLPSRAGTGSLTPSFSKLPPPAFATHVKSSSWQGHGDTHDLFDAAL